MGFKALLHDLFATLLLESIYHPDFISGGSLAVLVCCLTSTNVTV